MYHNKNILVLQPSEHIMIIFAFLTKTKNTCVMKVNNKYIKVKLRSYNNIRFYAIDIATNT